MTTPSDDPIPGFIHDLERMLSVAVIVTDIDLGPPAEIAALGMVDADTTQLFGRGATEADAWRDLAMAIAGWRNVDPRQVRMFLGGI